MSKGPVANFEMRRFAEQPAASLEPPCSPINTLSNGVAGAEQFNHP